VRDVWSLKYRPTKMSELLGQEIPKRIIHGALDRPEFPAACIVSVRKLWRGKNFDIKNYWKITYLFESKF
jgi:hypothetical protein